MKVSSAVDSWRLSKETLTIDFHRSKKQTVANIFNTARVNNIQRILLTQFALLGFFPLIEKVTVATAFQVRSSAQ